MNYIDIENTVLNKGDEQYEETIINWRITRRKLEIRCPNCDMFFEVPNDITVDANGYLSDQFYHFCDDQLIAETLEEGIGGFTALAHLVDWGL